MFECSSYPKVMRNPFLKSMERLRVELELLSPPVSNEAMPLPSFAIASSEKFSLSRRLK